MGRRPRLDAALLCIGFTSVVVLRQPGAQSAGAASSPIHVVQLPVVMNECAPCWSAAPLLLAPADGTELDTLVPLFQWDCGSDPDAVGTALEVATDPEFEDVLVSVSGLSDNGVQQHRFELNLTPGLYYWRAWLWCRSESEVARRGPFSEVRSFSTLPGGVVPSPPILLAPPNGSNPDPPVVLRWAAVPGAMEYAVCERPLPQTAYIWTWITETQHLTGGPGPGLTEEWWVMARNDYALSEPSEVWQFASPAAFSAPE